MCPYEAGAGSCMRERVCGRLKLVRHDVRSHINPLQVASIAEHRGTPSITTYLCNGLRRAVVSRNIAEQSRNIAAQGAD